MRQAKEDLTLSQPFYRYDDQGKGEIVGEKHGLVSITADRKTGKILGAAGSWTTRHRLRPHHDGRAPSKLNCRRIPLKSPSYHPTLGEIWTYVAEELMEEL